MPRKSKHPAELASDIGAAACDLYVLGDRQADEALAFVASANPEIFAWLAARLTKLATAPSGDQS